MARPVCVNILRIALMCTNVIFFLAGMSILALGVYILMNETANHFGAIVHDAGCLDCSKAVEVLKTPYVLMGLGGFIALMSFLGFLGACAESSCFLWLYSAILILSVGAEIVCAVLVAVKKEKIDTCLKCSMKHQVETQYNNTNFESGAEYRTKDHNTTTLLTKAWDAMQVSMKCCGASGPHDYRLSAWRNQTIEKSTPKQVPPTCCILSNSDPEHPHPNNGRTCQAEAGLFPDGATKAEFLYTAGCHYKFRKWVEDNIWIVVGILIGVILFQVVACIAACLLLGFYRREFDKYYPGSHSDQELDSLAMKT